MKNLNNFETKEEQLNHYFSEFYVEPYVSYNLETEEVLLTKQPIYTYVVEGWYSPSARMRYFDDKNEYIDFINELGITYKQDILIHYYIDTQVQEKVFLEEDDGFAHIGNTSEKPEDALHSYFFTYLNYNVKDEYGREISERIDLKPYYLKYSFVKKINQDILFGKPSEKPAEQQIWCWKGQSGINGSVYGYILPETLFNSFITDVISFYNLNKGGDWYGGSDYGMQTENFIVYFETEQKSYNTWVTRRYEESDIDSFDSTTLQNCYLTNFAYVDSDHIFRTIDLTDFVNQLPEDSEYRNHLVQMSDEILRGM